MFEGIVFGILQGIAEWLPVSSEGVIVLVKVNFFGGGGLEDILKFALFLHLGTAFAAIIYFKKDVASVFKTLFLYKKAKEEDRLVFNFLFSATLISGFLGLLLLKVLSDLESFIESSAPVVTFFVGLLLIFTAYLQLKKKDIKNTEREIKDIKPRDGFVLGITQGFAALPGLSRSGLTVAVLLLRKFKDEEALKLSFLMSIPIVLAGNVLLNIKDFHLSLENIFGFLFAFVFGLLTIHILLKVAKKVNFGYFVLIFGIFMMLASFV